MAKNRPTWMEPLEPRALFSQWGHAVLTDGTKLEITANLALPAHIVVRVQGQDIVVEADGNETGVSVPTSMVDVIMVRGSNRGNIIQVDDSNAVDALGQPKHVSACIIGGAGNDVLTGGSGNDTIKGGGGDDIIDDGAGNDVIDGGPGNDYITAGDGSDTISGDSGNDVINVPIAPAPVQSSDILDGGTGRDTILAGAGNDVVIGGPGNDSLIGGSGSDTLLGGPGADSLVGGSGHDLMFGGPGRDHFFGQNSLDVVADRQSGEPMLIPITITAPMLSGTVSSAKAGDGTIQTVGGHAGGIDDPIVTQIFSNDGITSDFLIQDTTGAIEVLGNLDAVYMPAVQDIVSVTGPVFSPNGLYLITNPIAVTKTGHANAQFAMQTFTTATFANGSAMGLADQSELGMLAGVTFSPPGVFVAGSYTVTVADGTTATVIIPAGSSLIGMSIPTGMVTSTLTGYLSQNDSTLGTNTATSTNGFELVVTGLTSMASSMTTMARQMPAAGRTLTKM